MKRGDRVRLFSGSEVGTVVSINRLGLATVRWDSGRIGGFLLSQLQEVAAD